MAEALDTLITLGWWALGWLIVLSVIGSIVVLTAIATGAYTVRPAWALTRAGARRYAHRTRHDYEEAA
ncbi:hypothetical protein ABZ733_06880 [Streptomyces longwoodensis]|uniref:hypothetical protein n=1 Tax=Streptomyces longwoodensis TaxID=68231 RepID=UPI0033C7B754